MLKPIFIWQERVLRRIDTEKIKYVESLENYVKIHLTDDTSCMVRSTLANAYKKLPSDMFVKVHRSLVVSIYYIDKIMNDALAIGEVETILKGEITPQEETVPQAKIVLKGEIVLTEKFISIGRQYYKPLLAKLNII